MGILNTKKVLVRKIVSLLFSFVLVIGLFPHISIKADNLIDSEHTIGDIDEDGTITPKDVTLLRRYLAGGWNVQINMSLADIDQDGSVTPKDVTLLRRYLAGGWGVEMPTPMTTDEPEDDGKMSLLLTYDQTSAREMAKLLNDFREKEGTNYDSKLALIYDYDLEKAAMQRAAEIAVKFDLDHMRPDGESYKQTLAEYGFDISPRNILYAENILFGTEDTMELEDAFKTLKNNDGNKKIMLGYYTYVGIGHVKIDKTDFWVQLFSDEENKTITEVRAVDGEVEMSIAIPEILINNIVPEYVSGKTTVSVGATETLPIYTGKVTFAGSEADEIKISKLKFISGDEYVSVSDGKMVGLKKGIGSILAKVNGINVSVSIEVTD